MSPLAEPSECSTWVQAADDADEKSGPEWLHKPSGLQSPTAVEAHNNRCSTLKKGSHNFALEGRNVVIFGDSGVGKSSLINLLNGRKIAETSDGAIGCTFESRRYSISIFGEKVNIWDTAGLDEGTEGRVPARTAENNLSKLLRELRGANGVHLLVYCMRGSSVRKSLAKNYAIFYSAMCRKKVPIVAVVTGLENYPSESESMDDWWTKGGKQLEKYKMRFDDHACVTTMDTQNAAGTAYEERSILSQKLLRDLIIKHCHSVTSRPPSDTALFIKTVLQDFRSMMKSGSEVAQPSSTIVFCQSDIPLFHLGFFGDVRRITSQINGRTLVFQHAGDLSEHYVTPRISNGGADLLVFAGTLSNPNVERLQRFYALCAGEVSPLLVVTYHSYVDAWKKRLNALQIDAHVKPVFSSSDLLNVVEELCLVRGHVKSRKANLLRFFRSRTGGDEWDDGALAEAGGP